MSPPRRAVGSYAGDVHVQPRAANRPAQLGRDPCRMFLGHVRRVSDKTTMAIDSSGLGVLPWLTAAPSASVSAGGSRHHGANRRRAARRRAHRRNKLDSRRVREVNLTSVPPKIRRHQLIVCQWFSPSGGIHRGSGKSAASCERMDVGLVARAQCVRRLAIEASSVRSRMPAVARNLSSSFSSRPVVGSTDVRIGSSRNTAHRSTTAVAPPWRRSAALPWPTRWSMPSDHERSRVEDRRQSRRTPRLFIVLRTERSRREPAERRDGSRAASRRPALPVRSQLRRSSPPF